MFKTTEIKVNVKGKADARDNHAWSCSAGRGNGHRHPPGVLQAANTSVKGCGAQFIVSLVESQRTTAKE